MNWEKLDLHLENLIPGLALLGLVLLRHGGVVSSNALLGAVAVGAAYLAGVLANVVGRLALDPASEYLARAAIFRLFARHKMPGVQCASRDRINRAYNKACTLALAPKSKRAARAEIAAEVKKRRQTTRLLRSSLVPLLALVGVFQAGDWGAVVTSWAVLFWVLLGLYCYSEVVIFHEAFHAVPEDGRSIDDLAPTGDLSTTVERRVTFWDDLRGFTFLGKLAVTLIGVGPFFWVFWGAYERKSWESWIGMVFSVACAVFLCVRLMAPKSIERDGSTWLQRFCRLAPPGEVDIGWSVDAAARRLLAKHNMDPDGRDLGSRPQAGPDLTTVRAAIQDQIAAVEVSREKLFAAAVQRAEEVAWPQTVAAPS